MEIGSLILLIALLIIVGVYVYSPVINGEYHELSQERKNLILIESQQKAVLKSLVDLDFDFEIGKISSEDHQLNRVGLLLRAETIYQKISNIQANISLNISDTQIEKKIKNYKNSLSQISNCSECGLPIFTSDKYCGECGFWNQK